MGIVVTAALLFTTTGQNRIMQQEVSEGFWLFDFAEFVWKNLFQCLILSEIQLGLPPKATIFQENLNSQKELTTKYRGVVHESELAAPFV